MTFDAGSIEAQLTLDRTPFQAGLAAAKREARDFTRQRITAQLDVDADTRKARASIERMKRSFDRKTTIDVDIDAGKAEAELAALRAQLAATKREGRDFGNQSAASFGQLFDAIVVLGPALVPLASGLVGLSAGMIAVGVDGVLAFKGISAEVKKGTALGQQYITMGKTAKGVLADLEHTAAQGVLAPLQKEVTQLNRDMPQLNAFVARTSGIAGSIVTHGADALLHLFVTAEPLIVSAEQTLDKMVTRLDNWASSGGGQSFFHALENDIPIAVNAIGDLFSVLGGLISGLEPVGHVILGIVDGGLKVLEVVEKVPGAVTILTTVLIAYRIKALLATGATAIMARMFGEAAVAESAETLALRENTLALIANASARRVAGGAAGLSSVRAYGAGAAGAGAGLAEGEAVAGGGLLARSSGFLLTKALPAAIIAYLGGSVAGQLAEPLRNSNSAAARGLGGGLSFLQDVGTFKPVTGSLSALGDLFSGNFGSIGRDLFPNTANAYQASNRVTSRQAEQAYVDAEIRKYRLDQYGFHMPTPIFRPSGSAGPVLGSQGTTAISTYDPQSAYRAFLNTTSGRYYSQSSAVNNRLSGQIGGMADPSRIADANNTITTSIQKRLSLENKLFDTSKGEITLTNGLTVSYGAYQKEMESTGGSLVQTTQFFKAHQMAADNDQQTLDILAGRTQLYNTFLTDSTVKYKVAEQNIGTYSAALGLNYDKITQNAASEKLAAKALGEANDAFANGDTAMQGWLATISQVDLNTDSLTQRVTILGAGLNALRGVQLDQAGANLSAVSALESASNAIYQNTDAIGKNGQLLGQLTRTTHGYVVEQPKLTAGALSVQQAMAGAAQQAIGLAQTIYQNTGKVGPAFAAYSGFARQFGSTLKTQTDLSDRQIAGLTRQIFGPLTSEKHFVRLLAKDDVTGAIRSLTKKLGQFTTQIWRAIVGVNDQTATPLSVIHNSLLALTGQSYLVKVGAIPDRKHPPPGNLGQLIPGGATGMIVTAGTTPTADDVLIRVSRGEAVIPADQTSKHYSLVNALINKTHGYASGYVPPSLITDKGSGSGSGGGSGSGSSSRKNMLDRLISMLSGDVSGFSPLGQITSNGPSLKSIAADLHRIVENTGMSARLAHKFSRDSTAYSNTVAQERALTRQLGLDRTKLSNVRQERSAVVGTVLGAFDPGQSGNGYGYGIQASLQKDIDDASKFKRLRAKAKKLGLNPALLKQITEEGPEAAGANLEAITQGGKGYVANLNKMYGQFRGLAGDLGDAQTRDTYGTTQTALSKRIHDEAVRQTKLHREELAELRKLRADLIKIRTELKNAARTA